MAGTGVTTEIEKENLEAHVELCGQRYTQLENRLSNLDIKVETLLETIEKNQLSTIKVLIGTAGTVIVGVLTTMGVILTKLH